MLQDLPPPEPGKVNIFNASGQCLASVDVGEKHAFQPFVRMHMAAIRDICRGIDYLELTADMIDDWLRSPDPDLFKAITKTKQFLFVNEHLNDCFRQASGGRDLNIAEVRFPVSED
jgi:hypothetical protein